MHYWLFKTEPDTFSIEDLANSPARKEGWDGVRNYQARNYMRDDMEVDDLAFVYHSSCKTPGIAGLAKISKTGLIDPLQFDPESHYFDPKATKECPRWFMVELMHLETFEKVLPLSVIKKHPSVSEIPLLNRSRLSVMPVVEDEFNLLLNLSRSQ